MEFDYVVIGAGSAGCAVAGRLSEDGRARILLLEAGGSDRRLPVLMPAATYLLAIGNPRYDWRYKAAADPSRNDRRDYMPRGKVLGGTSSINGMCYVRGQPEDFDVWAQMGCQGWDFASILPFYRRAEDNENGADEYHGSGGPLSVSNIRSPHPLSEIFLQACANAGLPRKADINRPPQDGIGFLQATQRHGWRCSASRAYLWPARRRANLKLITRAHVARVTFSGKRATGVEYVREGRRQTAKASRAVILCAGALASPQLLMLSGIGPEAHLREKGITVLQDLPGVGENFHDHPGTSHTVWTRDRTYNVQHGFLSSMLYGAQWLLTGRGPGSTPDAHVIGFTRSEPALDRCDIQYHFTPAGYDLTENGPILFDRPAATGLVNIHRPRSRGWIRLQSADPFDQPQIQPNLLGDEHDRETLIRGHRRMRRICETDPMARHVIGEFKPGSDVQSDDEWRAFVRETAIGFYHPAGSCKMGTDRMAVVDERLKLRGLEGLYVADASIMPIVVSGNLNATCIMIGEKCADMLRQAP